jgi:hypothetical protein
MIGKVNSCFTPVTFDSVQFLKIYAVQESNVVRVDVETVYIELAT